MFSSQQLTIAFALYLAALSLMGCQSTSQHEPESSKSPLNSSTGSDSAEFYKNAKQLIFEGKRSGEGYFSQDGSMIIFQSERETDNPFYQMYLLNMKSGEVQRLSPGTGKTTCGWIHPSNKKVLFSSTHHDPKIKAKQAEEFQERSKGGHRYSWSFDEMYEIYESDPQGRKLKRLTRNRGYDAEGSYSPDGKLIVFASNRHAYSSKLNGEEKILFEKDPSYFMEIYIMRDDGREVRRLTNYGGYDGGPFFSPDGQRIVWRRFGSDGKTAEIFTMALDGSDVRQITKMGHLSWAPFYHPSGDYIIFATSAHGHQNFELYMVDSEGTHQPIRVTQRDGFDGLPVFSPDGRHLLWSSSQTSRNEAQLFMAEWDDQAVRRALKLPEPKAELPSHYQLSPEIKIEDAQRIVTYLASPHLQGRLTGSDAEKEYTGQIARFFSNLGLKPGGSSSSFLQEFDFTSGVQLGANNKLLINGKVGPEVDSEWRPLSFSHSGSYPDAPIVFVGYGIVSPKTETVSEYDSYAGLDVKDKWVLALRYSPDEVSEEERLHYTHFSSLRYKSLLARERGAKGILFVSGPASKVQEELVPLRMDGSSVGDTMAVLSLKDGLVESWFKENQKEFGEIHSALNRGEKLNGFELNGLIVSAHVDLLPIRKKGVNVIGMIHQHPSKPTILIGAHGDHLGKGDVESSLARGDEKGQIHYGADDNASGVATVLELAHHFKVHPAKNLNLIFAIWSGEEIGMLGSNHFITQSSQKGVKLNSHVAAYLNFDMVGRLRDKLIIQGSGSAKEWISLIERTTMQTKMSVTTQTDPYLPTDSTAFYIAGVPGLNFFTGAHQEYHTPRDRVETINFEGLTNVARFAGSLLRSVNQRRIPLTYAKTERKSEEQGTNRGGLRVWLGTIPDYAQEGNEGVKISGVTKGSPAERAGLKDHDTVVRLGSRTIKNLYDYTYALQASKIGEPTKITILREGKRMELSIVPASRH